VFDVYDGIEFLEFEDVYVEFVGFDCVFIGEGYVGVVILGD